MAGRGLIENQDSIIHPSVFALNKNNEWVAAQDPKLVLRHEYQVSRLKPQAG